MYNEMCALISARSRIEPRPRKGRSRRGRCFVGRHVGVFLQSLTLKGSPFSLFSLCFVLSLSVLRVEHARIAHSGGERSPCFSYNHRAAAAGHGAEGGGHFSLQRDERGEKKGSKKKEREWNFLSAKSQKRSFERCCFFFAAPLVTVPAFKRIHDDLCAPGREPPLVLVQRRASLALQRGPQGRRGRRP